MNKVTQYSKAIAAVVGVVLTFLVSRGVVNDGTAQDITTAIMGFVTILGVYWVPNTKPASGA